MVFGDCYYSVLVVSAAEKFNATMATLLPSTDYYPVKFVTNIAAAKRAYLEQQYDFVIINAPLPDDFGTRFATDVTRGNGTVALLIVRAESYEDIRAKVVFLTAWEWTKSTWRHLYRIIQIAKSRSLKIEVTDSSCVVVRFISLAA